MKTNFKDYLKKKKTQEIIDKYAKKFEGKKIVLFGIDLFTGDLFRNYDLSKLNIIGISDINFKENDTDKYYDIPKILPLDLLEAEFDLLLITTYDDVEAKSYLKKNLFQGEEMNFKIKTLIKMNIVEYVKALMNGDI